jgi:hypothetical protein
LVNKFDAGSVVTAIWTWSFWYWVFSIAILFSLSFLLLRFYFFHLKLLLVLSVVSSISCIGSFVVLERLFCLEVTVISLWLLSCSPNLGFFCHHHNGPFITGKAFVLSDEILWILL